MPEPLLITVTRVDLIGEFEAEPVRVDRDPDGWVTFTLDDGQLLQFDPQAARALGACVAGDQVQERRAA